MTDGTNTCCPYCGAINNSGNYVWRFVNLTSQMNFPEPSPVLQAVEVYCAKCHRTLSITPLYSNSLQVVR